MGSFFSVERKSVVMEAAAATALAAATVYTQRALDADTQEYLYDLAMKLGEDPVMGFYTIDDVGERLLNVANQRGRVFREIVNLEEEDQRRLKDICSRMVAIAREALSHGEGEKDAASLLPYAEPTHILIQYYADTVGMMWHCDADANDGDGEFSIVSVSLGNTARFGYHTHPKEDEKYVELSHGDCLVWGGPNRMLIHCVDKVIPGTSPVSCLSARLNFTFRYAPSIAGREAEFQMRGGY
jgi:hypothetical protein